MKVEIIGKFGCQGGADGSGGTILYKRNPDGSLGDLIKLPNPEADSIFSQALHMNGANPIVKLDVNRHGVVTKINGQKIP